MSKPKDVINSIRNKVFERQKESVVEAAEQKIEETKEMVVYDIVQDPRTKSRAFLIVKIAFDIETMTARLEEVVPFADKTVALSIQMDKENRKYLFDKYSKGSKK
jgi:hypothetical protein